MTELNNDEAPISPPRGKDILCKSCHSILGSISSTGLLDPTRGRPAAATGDSTTTALQSEPAKPTEGSENADDRSTQQPCDTCRPLEELHAAVVRAQAAFEEVRHRRKDYRPREDAMTAVIASRSAFANFVLAVEQVDQHETSSTSNEDEQEKQIAEQTTDQPQLQQAPAESAGEIAISKKRARSLSALTSTPKNESVAGPSSPKRPRRTKRVSFDPSTVENQYRTTEMFYRTNVEAYVPGKFAPPDGQEYWDTSGANKVWADFHQLKWVGRKWVYSSDPPPDSEDSDTEPVGPVKTPPSAAPSANLVRALKSLESPEIDALLSPPVDTKTSCVQVPNSPAKEGGEAAIRNGQGNTSSDSAMANGDVVPAETELAEPARDIVNRIEESPPPAPTVRSDLSNPGDGAADAQAQEAVVSEGYATVDEATTGTAAMVLESTLSATSDQIGGPASAHHKVDSEVELHDQSV